MTTRELAAYIQMNEKTVIKMAQEGTLPGVKLGNKWRFMLSVIDAYLQKSVVASEDHELDSLIRTGGNIIPLSRLTDSNLIVLNFKAKVAEDVLRKLSQIAESENLVSNAANLLTQLKNRENLLSTAVGNGVALPHARNPKIGLFSSPKIVILQTEKGVDFRAPDGLPTQLFFMICAPNSFVHVRLLAKVAKVLHVKGVIEKFKAAKETNEIISVLLELERNEIIKGIE